MPVEPSKSPPVARQRPRLNRTRVGEVAGSAPARFQCRLEFHLALDQRVITSFVRGQVRLRKVEKSARPAGVIAEQVRIKAHGRFIGGAQANADSLKSEIRIGFSRHRRQADGVRKHRAIVHPRTG